MRMFYLLFLPVLLYAQSFLISTIPLPKSYVQNLDIYACDTECLRQLAAEEQAFSFLAHAQDRLEDAELNEFRLIHVALFNIGSYRADDRLRIALLLPHRVIGRYAFSTTNAAFAYLLTKNRAFELKTFQVESEGYEDMQKALSVIEQEAFYYVVAPVTQQGAETITALSPDMNIFFPTINKRDMNGTAPTFYYGGIDYRQQIDTLLGEANASLVMFSDSSRLGQQLEGYTREQYALRLAMDENATDVNASVNPRMYEVAVMDGNETRIEQREKRVISFQIDKHTSNLERELSGNDAIEYGNFFLNTPIVKSSMVMSQLTLYDVNVTNILSTQISYDPLILSMTQYADREKMIIANSIDTHNNVMIETNALLGNDIMYDWINYATTIGVDYFYHSITRNEREYDLPIVENQVEYPIRLVRPSFSRFIPYVYDAGESVEESVQ